MEDKKTKDKKKTLPAANSFSNPDNSGWIFILNNEGIMRKKWRKKFCILSNAVLYMYENQSSSGTEKTCSSINLKLFQHCAKAPDKDSKKSVHTLALEPDKEKSGKTDKTKNNSQATRRLFYPEAGDEMERWISKLNDAISLSSAGSNSTLTHLTKTRAGPPRGNRGRRPPSKAHLKERALLTEVAIEEVSPKDEGTKKSKQGSFPAAAMKPRPLGSKKTEVPDAVTEANGVGVNGKAGPPKPPSKALKPSVNLSPRKSEESDTTTTVDEKEAPQLPPADLEPSVEVSKKLSNEDEPEEDDNSGEKDSDEIDPETNAEEKDAPKPPSADLESTENVPEKSSVESDESEDEHVAPKDAPKPPSADLESTENVPEKSSVELDESEDEHIDEDDVSPVLSPVSEDISKDSSDLDDPERDTAAAEENQSSETPADVEPSTPAVENGAIEHGDKEGCSTETCIENEESPPSQPEKCDSGDSDGKQPALTDNSEDGNHTQESPKESITNTDESSQSEEVTQKS